MDESAQSKAKTVAPATHQAYHTRGSQRAERYHAEAAQDNSRYHYYTL